MKQRLHQPIGCTSVCRSSILRKDPAFQAEYSLFPHMQQAVSGFHLALPVAFRYYSLFINKTFDLMRKARIKMMLVAAVTAVALLFAGASSLQAQTITGEDPFYPPTGNFVTPAEAEVILTGQVASLKGLLETLTPGTQAYILTERSLYYYITILNEVAAGKNIPVSIVAGLGYVSADDNGITSAELLGYKQDAVTMLSQ